MCIWKMFDSRKDYYDIYIKDMVAIVYALMKSRHFVLGVLLQQR